MNTCKICGHETYDIIHPRFQLVFHVCPVCELIVKDKKHLISSAEEKKIYDRHQNSLENHGYVNYLTNFMESAVLPFSIGKKALDFGSGPTPVFATILHDEGFDVRIYDLFYAPDRAVLESEYDVITAIEVIEHLADPKTVFQMLSKMLTANGILAVMTLFYPKDQATFFDWFYIRDKSHISFYSPKTIAVLAEMSGLEVIFSNHHRHITMRLKKSSDYDLSF